MTDIKYTLWNPNGNITALVETAVDREYYAVIAAKILKKEACCEQVGFLLENSMCMAGDEFCGNASMSAASYFFMNGKDDDSPKKQVVFSVSGCDEKVKAEVSKTEKGFDAVLTMPRHKRIFKRDFSFNGKVYNLPVVDFDGIMHIIIENVSFDKSSVERHIKAWCNELNAKSVGAMLFDRKERVLTPLVFVKAIDTLFWESSCASGTASVGAYLADEMGVKTEMTLIEPAGEITVISEPNGRTLLKGSVEIMQSGTVSI